MDNVLLSGETAPDGKYRLGFVNHIVEERSKNQNINVLMTTESITQLLAENKAKLAKEFGIQQLGNLGSVAEGMAGGGSDIDLFYDLGVGAFLDLQRLEAFEERAKRILRCCKVDLVNLRT